MKLTSLVAATAFCAVVVSFGSAPAPAQVSCSDAKIFDRLPKLPDGCQKERIEAAGNQRPSVGWAKSSAKDAWRDQVQRKFGERYTAWDNAVCAREDCGPAALAGFKRCTFNGIPCARTVVLEGVYELNTAEIQELQKLLNKYLKVKGSVDGRFGEKTGRYLETWLKTKNIKAEPEPTRSNLDLLRKG